MLGFLRVQPIYYFFGFRFVGVRDSAYGADFFASSAEHHAAVWVYGGYFFAVFLFKLECLHVAEFYAFTASCTFGIIDFWVPWDFVARDSFVFFFGHIVHLKNKYS
jgi:hypothetical protein